VRTAKDHDNDNEDDSDYYNDNKMTTMLTAIMNEKWRW